MGIFLVKSSESRTLTCVSFLNQSVFHSLSIALLYFKKSTKAIYCLYLQHVKFLLTLSEIVVIYWTCHQSENIPFLRLQFSLLIYQQLV